MTVTDTRLTVEDSKSVINAVLDEAFAAKIVKVADREPPAAYSFPYITKEGEYDYQYYPLSWWTSGFFPGSIWALYERSLKRGFQSFSQDRLLNCAINWSHKLESHKNTLNTHDVGFLIMPSYLREYELTGSKQAGSVIVQAAESLLTRWSETAQAIKSWEKSITGSYEFSNPKSDILVIIDNMMNLELLYRASVISQDTKFAEKATKHAETTAKYHIRRDFSTYHLVVYDAVTGRRKVGLTHQGYDHESTWSRGQAWALYGYASVYQYTKDEKYLTLAKKLADYFISRSDDGIVYWDFDAPRPGPWDTSAAVVAASGLLLICQLEKNLNYLQPALKLLEVVLDQALAPEDGDVILDRATAANYRYYKNPTKNHGLVYADYYLIEAGNRLVDLNLIDQL
jgi:hypothetical protein